jgi:nitroreductase
MGVWRIVDGRTTPQKTELCNRCCHCVAVCPTEAIIHRGLDMQQITKVNRANLNPDVFHDVVVSRRSIRQFQDKPVPRELIERIIHLASFAPTASNDQNVGYTIITDKELLAQTARKIFDVANFFYNLSKTTIGRILMNLSGLSKNRYVRVMEYVQAKTMDEGRDFILHKAPVLILIHAPRRRPFASDNCNIAAATIVHYAHALGLGTCFIGMMALLLRFHFKLRKRLGVPAGRKVFAVLVMGYPAYLFTHTVSRKKPEVCWR